MLKYSDFNFGKVIDRSPFYILLEVTSLKTNEVMNAKMYRIPDFKSKIYSNVLNEVVLLARSAHPNIINFYGFCQKNSVDPALNEEYIAFYVLFEKIEKNLKQEIHSKRQNGKYFNISEITNFISQIFSAFIHLQNINISQNEFSPKTIIITETKYKLGDLGSARNLYGATDFTYDKSNQPYLSYFAPEKLEAFAKGFGKLENNLKVSEVFSFGLVLLKMCTLCKIKGLNRGNEAMNDINKFLIDVEKRYNTNLSNFIKELLIIDPDKRKSFEELQKTSLFSNLISDKNNKQVQYNTLFQQSEVLKDNFCSKIEEYPINENGFKEISGKIEKMIYEAEKLRRNSQFTKSMEVYEECLKLKKIISQENFGKDIQTSDIQYSLGHVYIELGNFKKGLENHESALEIRINILGPEHKAAADSYNSIGVSHHGQGNFQKGLEYFEKALKLYEKLFGLNSKEAALGYNNVGGSFSLLGDHKKALEYKLKALNIKKNNFGEETEDTAWSFDNVGVEYSELGNKEKALEFKTKALEIRKKLFGDENPQTAISYNNLAVEYGNMGETKKSLTFHMKAYDIRLKILGEEHPETARSYHNIGCCYYTDEKLDLALENYNKAYNIRNKLLGPDHKDTLRSLKEMEDIKKKIKIKKGNNN